MPDVEPNPSAIRQVRDTVRNCILYQRLQEQGRQQIFERLRFSVLLQV